MRTFPSVRNTSTGKDATDDAIRSTQAHTAASWSARSVVTSRPVSATAYGPNWWPSCDMAYVERVSPWSFCRPNLNRVISQPTIRPHTAAHQQ